MELGFWIPIFSRIPDSLSCIPDFKAQDSRFHKEKVPGFRNPHHLTWGGKDKRLFRMKKKWITDDKFELGCPSVSFRCIVSPRSFQCIGPAFGAGRIVRKKEEHVMNVFLFVWTQWIVLIFYSDIYVNCCCNNFPQVSMDVHGHLKVVELKHAWVSFKLTIFLVIRINSNRQIFT